MHEFGALTCVNARETLVVDRWDLVTGGTRGTGRAIRGRLEADGASDGGAR